MPHWFKARSDWYAVYFYCSGLVERDYLEQEFVTGVNYSYHQKVKINFSSVKLHPKAET